MSTGDSLGFVETIGLVAAVEAADAMVKAARVQVRTVANADAGLLSVVCQGDLAACMAAVDAAKAAAARVGGVVTSNIIARPEGDTEALVTKRIGSIISPPPAPPEEKPKGKGEKGRK
jgi:microcompartment protein CcmL/EutN